MFCVIRWVLTLCEVLVGGGGGGVMSADFLTLTTNGVLMGAIASHELVTLLLVLSTHPLV